MADYSEDIARLVKTREALLKEGSETGRPVYLRIAAIERSIQAMVDAGRASAVREYGGRGREREL